jgi:Endoribonuclease L-PSP
MPVYPGALLPRGCHDWSISSPQDRAWFGSFQEIQGPSVGWLRLTGRHRRATFACLAGLRQPFTIAVSGRDATARCSGSAGSLISTWAPIALPGTSEARIRDARASNERRPANRGRRDALAAKRPKKDDVRKPRIVMANLTRCLEAAGATWSDVVRTDTFLTDMDDQDAIGAVMGAYFRGDFPASTWVEVKRLVDLRLRLEMNAIAVVPGRD